MFDSVSLWGMHAADLVSLVPSALAIYAGYSAWRAQPRWLMARRRHLAMKRVGISKKLTRLRVKQIISGTARTSADELNWLATAIPASSHGPNLPMPLTFDSSSDLLTSLSDAYAAYAADLRRGSFLGTTAVPVVEHDAAVAHQTSLLLSEAASGGGCSAATSTSRHICLSSESLDRTLEIWQLPDVDSGTLAYDVFVSYRRHRIAPTYQESSSAAQTASQPLEAADLETAVLPTSEEQNEVLRRKFSGQHSFDGVLPRLIDWRTERDNGNGRLRLHLAMAETTYAAVLVDHYPQTFTGLDDPQPQRREEAKGDRAKLLTLSTVLVTSDRMLLFAGRSRNAGSHQDKFGPAVNGNLELRVRNGVHVDSGVSGIPDPLRALAREAREELGLALDHRQIQVVGMGKFSVAKEQGTHVLLTIAQPSLTAAEIISGLRDADPMEGRWELGGEFLAAPLPDRMEDVEPLLSWLLHDPRLTPHATLTGIAAVARHHPVTHDQLRRLAADPHDTPYEPLSLTTKF